MASKKPAKKNTTTMAVKEKELPGKAVKYFGSKMAAPFMCPECSRTLSKGIIYEHNSKLFCSRKCIGSVLT